MWKSLAKHAAILAMPLAAVLAPGAQAETGYRVSGPITYDNLSVYFVHGKSTEGRVPLTLQEALAKSAVVVHETGTVNRLEIENTSDEEIFIQAGDIVKGGQQDRVLAVSLTLAPKSGRMPIGAYCVEQGRWTARGIEDVKRFASADKAMPSREAKMALLGVGREPASPARDGAGAAVRGRPDASLNAAHPADPRGPNAVEDRERVIAELRNLAQQEIQQQRQRRATGGASAQSEVWASVASTQRKLSENLKAAVASPQSASSLQLSLENQKLDDARRAYIEKLKAAGETEQDVLGFVVAINGKLTSGELYPSNGLFRKMWAKQLDANATEAIGEKSAKAAEPPSADAALAFLSAAEQGKATTTQIDARLTREARDADHAVLVETRASGGQLVHRSYLAKK